ncbi:MAG: patatin-like phospholipase family protein [Candidatus Woesearchaeota archaeon]
MIKGRNQKKVALVLSGGGAKGFAHYGLIKELENYAVSIEYIVGTSMGAIIGATYALYNSLEPLEPFIDFETKDLFSLKDISFKGKGLLKGKKIEKLLEAVFKDAEFKDTKIPLLITAVDIQTGDETVFSSGSIIKAIRASISIPFVFEPFEDNGAFYMDGGISNNMPYAYVPKTFRKVILSNSNAYLPKINKKDSGIKFLFHFITLMENTTTKMPKGKKFIPIMPHLENIYLWDFEKIDEAIQKGKEEAQRVLPKYFKRK